MHFAFSLHVFCMYFACILHVFCMYVQVAQDADSNLHSETSISAFENRGFHLGVEGLDIAQFEGREKCTKKFVVETLHFLNSDFLNVLRGVLLLLLLLLLPPHSASSASALALLAECAKFCSCMRSQMQNCQCD